MLILADTRQDDLKLAEDLADRRSVLHRHTITGVVDGDTVPSHLHEDLIGKHDKVR